MTRLDPLTPLPPLPPAGPGLGPACPPRLHATLRSFFRGRDHFRGRGGFTLVELLVVIGIIGLLVGLVIVAGVSLQQSAAESRARTMLAGLGGVASEYEATTGETIPHAAIRGGELDDNASDDESLFEWDEPKRKNAPGSTGNGNLDQTPGSPAGAANLYIERFVWAAYQNPMLRSALESLGPGALADTDDDGFLEVIDPWDNNFAYAARVDHDDNADNADQDNFLPERRSPFFASAGADGAWGDASRLNDDQLKAQLQDNLYSFDLDRSFDAERN